METKRLSRTSAVVKQITKGGSDTCLVTLSFANNQERSIEITAGEARNFYVGQDVVVEMRGMTRHMVAAAAIRFAEGIVHGTAS